MKLTRLKQLLAAAGLLLGLVGGVAVLTGAAIIVVQTGTGADPADAFTPTDLIPESLRGTVNWLDDTPSLDRAMEPTTRRALEAAWLRQSAAAELDTASGPRALDHELQISFYSLDGQVVGATATTLVARDLGDRTVVMRELHEAVIILTDGRWEFEQLVRVGAELTAAVDGSAS